MAIKHHNDRWAHQRIDQVNNTESEIYTTFQLADMIQVSVAWLEIGRSRGYGPKFIRISPRMVRYSRTDVVKWLESRAHQHTAEYIRRPSQVA
jgi:predicted DNA-binding transcriptional regulator AlpA